MKKKGAGMVMTIILVAVFGWVAIVVFVIKPDIVAGAFLSIAGGVTIGLIIAYLMWRWWFKGIPDQYRIDVKQVDKTKKWELGTRLQKNFIPCRYACAGEDLKKGMLVEANLSGRLVIGKPLPQGKEIHDLIYGSVKHATEVDRHGIRVLGWPQVNVPKYRYFWLQEPPMGAEWKEEDRDVS